MDIAHEILTTINDDPDSIKKVTTDDEARVYDYEIEPKPNHPINGSIREPSPKKNHVKFDQI